MKPQLLPGLRADYWLKTGLNQYALALERLGILPTKYLLVVSISQQRLYVFDDGLLISRFVASTSKFGIGQVQDSNCTPLGLHRIARKIGGGWPVGTVFKARQPIGLTWQGMPSATITNRIFWLEGLEPGFNQGGNVDTFRRYIYIHGVGDELTLGRPASHGCIHLAGVDLLPLYDRVPEKMHVWIAV